MVLNAGDLDRRITIQRATETRDAFNNPIPSWSALATLWASKEDVRDSERLAAQELGADITTRFRIRWSELAETISPLDRILFGDRIFEIVAVKEISRREGIEISATARAETPVP
jgi:SPP1 family predicted phage head-tail adaptor